MNQKNTLIIIQYSDTKILQKWEYYDQRKPCTKTNNSILKIFTLIEKQKRWLTRRILWGYNQSRHCIINCNGRLQLKKKKRKGLLIEPYGLDMRNERGDRLNTLAEVWINNAWLILTDPGIWKTKTKRN